MNYSLLEKISNFLLFSNVFIFFGLYFLGPEQGFYEDRMTFLIDYKFWLFLGVLAFSVLLSFLLRQFFLFIFGKQVIKDKKKWLIKEFLSFFSFYFISIIGLIFSLGFGFQIKFILFFLASSILMWRSFPRDFPKKIRV